MARTEKQKVEAKVRKAAKAAPIMKEGTAKEATKAGSDVKILEMTATAVETLKSQRSKYKTYERIQARANKQLYAVLGEAFDVFVALNTGEDSKKQIAVFNEKIKNQKGSYATHATQATGLALRIVRFICGGIADKTATNYARVIKVAYDNKVQNLTHSTFSEWVTAAGGIDAVRRTKDNTEVKDYFKVGKSICAIANEVEIAEANTESEHAFSIALIRNNADGTQSVVWSSNKATFVTPALKAAGKDLEESYNEAEAEQTTIDAEAELHAAANSTTAEVVESNDELQAEAA